MQKLDIVVHSMGYAYSLGIIEKIIEERDKEGGIKLQFDRFYIIAPENAGTNSSREFFDKDILEAFTEVWQYGSKRDYPTPIKDNEGRIDEDSIKEQDDVAPQRGIPIFINLGGDETVTE